MKKSLILAATALSMVGTNVLAQASTDQVIIFRPLPDNKAAGGIPGDPATVPETPGEPLPPLEPPLEPVGEPVDLVSKVIYARECTDVCKSLTYLTPSDQPSNIMSVEVGEATVAQCAGQTGYSNAEIDMVFDEYLYPTDFGGIPSCFPDDLDESEFIHTTSYKCEMKAERQTDGSTKIENVYSEQCFKTVEDERLHFMTGMPAHFGNFSRVADSECSPNPNTLEEDAYVNRLIAPDPQFQMTAPGAGPGECTANFVVLGEPKIEVAQAPSDVRIMSRTGNGNPEVDNIDIEVEYVYACHRYQGSLLQDGFMNPQIIDTPGMFDMDDQNFNCSSEAATFIENNYSDLEAWDAYSGYNVPVKCDAYILDKLSASWAEIYDRNCTMAISRTTSSTGGTINVHIHGVMPDFKVDELENFFGLMPPLVGNTITVDSEHGPSF